MNLEKNLMKRCKRQVETGNVENEKKQMTQK